MNYTCILYNGSYDPAYENTLVVCTDCLIHKKVIVKEPVTLLLDYGLIIFVTTRDHRYRFIKQDNTLIGGPGDIFIYGVLYGDQWFRLFDSSSCIMGYEGHYSKDGSGVSCLFTSVPNDPMLALIHYHKQRFGQGQIRKYEVDMTKVIYGKDLLRYHTSRGIKVTKKLCDVVVVCI